MSAEADAAPIGPEPAHDGVPEGSLDPATDAMVKPTPGYPDLLVDVPDDHPARDDARSPTWAQHGDRLTTNYGVRVDNTDNTLRVGPRGPSLLEDPHAREKISHFDHERIPERVVHARGVAAHGHFTPYESQAPLTTAAFLADPEVSTPVFVRFSTVLGSKGAPTPARETRGFAVKFYTSAGNFDIVGNNIPVFFIHDGIKFPDLVHALKPEHHREIPQAATAHDTAWDFFSLLPESTHHVMWSMSDRALPRSYRTMQGFGVHTFRLVNAEGATTLAKFHWKPLLGTHSMAWEETQKLGGVDPDWHHRDLYDAIESGAFPEWELGLQLFEDSEDQLFEGIDLLDSTKLVPEELSPVIPVGRLVLDRNTTDAFAETEQVAYCTSHLVPGIDVTDDPLLAARNFSYQDTQLTRLGGPNFEFLPINRSRAPVNSMQVDGYGQSAILQGRAFYSPNSLGGGCPMTSMAQEGGFVHVPRAVAGAVGRQRSEPKPDYFSQATMFWRSMSEVEKDHIITAFSFELGKVELVHIRERMLRNLAEVDSGLTAAVATNLGLPAPVATGVAADGSAAVAATESPALSQLPTQPGAIDGRQIAILAADGVDGDGVLAVGGAATAARARALVVAPHVGLLTAASGAPVPAAKSFLTSQSVEYDAVVVAGGSGAALLLADPYVATFVQEAYRHCKPVAAWGEGVEALMALGMDASQPGVVTGEAGDEGFAAELCADLGWHRFWERSSLSLTSMAAGS